jgi:uncharacterized damage-inducible protein DinB
MSRDALAASFSISQQIILGNVLDIDHEESLKQPQAEGNCLNWIAGHILASRASILEVLGEKPFLSEEEEKPYRRGTAPLKPGDNCAEFDKLRAGLMQSGGIIVSKLKSLDDDFIDAEIDPKEVPIPTEEPTRDGLLTFLLYHEAYHVGQLGLGRRLLAKAGAIK